MTPFIADGPMKGAQDRLGLAPGYSKNPPGHEAVDRPYSQEDYERSMRKSRMYDISVMLRQAEEMRQNAVSCRLPPVEYLFNEAVLQLSVAWAEIRKDVRRDDGLE